MTLPSMTKLKSTNIDAVGYRDGDLYVRFHDGAVYKHAAVDADIHKAMLATDSPGKFYHGRIKGKFVSDKLDIADEGATTAPNDGAYGGTKDWEEEILAAVGKLNPADDAHWTEDGLPDLNVLSDMLNHRVNRETLESVTDIRRPLHMQAVDPESAAFLADQAQAIKTLEEAGVLDFFREKHGIATYAATDRGQDGVWRYTLSKADNQVAFDGTLEELKALVSAG